MSIIIERSKLKFSEGSQLKLGAHKTATLAVSAVRARNAKLKCGF